MLPRSRSHALAKLRPPPGEQAYHTRWSLVFFTRPGNSVQLSALAAQSAVVARGVENAPVHLREIFESGETSFEWFTRRVKNMRTNNQKVRAPRFWPTMIETDGEGFTGRRRVEGRERHGTQASGRLKLILWSCGADGATSTIYDYTPSPPSIILSLTDECDALI